MNESKETNKIFKKNIYENNTKIVTQITRTKSDALKKTCLSL